MAKLICTDGTEIEISDETEANLRKAFGPKSELDKMKEWVDNYLLRNLPNSQIVTEFVQREGIDYLLISLPVANTAWTFNTWKTTMAFVEQFETTYPVHYFSGKPFTHETFISNVIIKLSI